MSISVDTPNTPGWWMLKLSQKLKGKQRRLRILNNYVIGRPPLAHGTLNMQSAFYQFQRVCRTNFADLIVSAPADRMGVRSIRTAAAGDDNGDQQAWAIWSANDLSVTETDIYHSFLTFGESYVSVGIDADDPGIPVIAGEDPRQTVTAEDAATGKTIAALKLFHDELQERDFAYLWLPGEMWVASRHRDARIVRHDPMDGPSPPVEVEFSPSTFDIDPDLSETYAVQEVPVVRFGNRGGVGEFELHTDLLDRINHMLLQRIVIATLQAFRQRAIELDPAAGDDGLIPETDNDGNPVDIDDLFAADPGALWQLPLGAKIWESGVVDLTPILSSVKDDAMHLAAVTKTPFPMFTPDAANQSAEGAQLTREGLVFKVEDRDKIAGGGWARVMSIAFAFIGDTVRADRSKIIVDWQPAERYSLAERASADSLAKSLPNAQKWRVIWGMTPDEVQIAQAQLASDALLAAALAPSPPAARTQPAGPVTPPATGDVPAA